MRRSGIVFLAVYVLFTITTAVSAADTKTATKPLQRAVLAPATVPVAQADSPLVRAARIGLEARMHPKARIVINSTTLVVTHWYEPSTAGAPTKESQGRSWASGNQNDAAAMAARDQSARSQRAAAEYTRQETLRQEQTYMRQQADEPYAEVNEDHVTNRLESIPNEMKARPPM